MLARYLRPLIRTVLQRWFRVQVVGESGQFNASRLLIIANHESFLDGLVLALFLPVDPVYVVHTHVAKNRWFRLLLAFVDYVAMDPTHPLGMKKVVKLVESGRPVLVFPEGRITVTGSLMKVYEGPAFAAARSGATIVPVRLDGPARSYFSRLAGRHPRRLFPRITVSIEPATRLDVPGDLSGKLRRRKAGEGMRRIMQRMIFSSQPKQTLYTQLLDTIEVQGRRRLIAEDIQGVEYSYGEVLRITLMLGRAVSRVSREGEHIGVLLPNLVSTVAMIIGLGALRRVPAMLNYTAGTEGLRGACAVAMIRTIVTSEVFVKQARLEAVLASLQEQGIAVVTLESLRAGIGVPDAIWVALHAAWWPRRVELSGDPEAPAVILFTSGSEACPKGVVLSHGALLSNISQVRAVIDFGIEDKMFNALPVFHSFGLTMGALLPLLTGTRTFIYPSPLHYRVIPELIYDRACTVLFGTPTFLKNYARFAHPYDFYKLRYVVAGAERLTEPVRAVWFEKFGIRILEGYGATETAPVLAINTPMAYRSGTVGQFLPGIEHRLQPLTGIDDGGQLHVRGPNLMSGYLRDAAPGVLEPPGSELGAGWYDTGDVVSIDEDGFVSIAGRLKRFAKLAGEMVSLEVVERLAASASPGAQHVASVQSDAKRGEVIVLFSTDPRLTREQMQEAAREHGHPRLAVPAKVGYLEAIPMLATGKVDYIAVQRLAASA
ncbi:MAG: bifunctional acyl-ACP--phospholipid O-acyltransferase/long-chain-fatty-acid--ACP ligase [Gammaproteobacteria bacterium]